MSVTRRQFIIGGVAASGALVIGISLLNDKPFPNQRKSALHANAWLQILPSDEYIFQLDKAEMGQGVYTSLTLNIAEDLDVHPSRITVEFAGVDRAYHDNLFHSQMTGGSSSTRSSFDQLRQAGAKARAMIITAAAAHWEVNRDAISTDNGVVFHRPTNRSLSYGDLATLASMQTAPILDIELKSPDKFKYIGKYQNRLDTQLKVETKAVYGIDVKLDNMKIAMVARCPYVGGTLISFDSKKAKAVEGVSHIFEIHTGVVVVADHYWQALQGIQKLFVYWDKADSRKINDKYIRDQYEHTLATEEGHRSTDIGDIDKAFDMPEAATQIEAEYYVPFAHHSTMEPQNCTAWLKGELLEIWVPTQSNEIARYVAAYHTGIEESNIKVNTTFLGGGFGRRLYNDYVCEASVIAQKMAGTPIKLMWTREDDMRHDYYRAGSLHKVKAALDKNGRVTAWQHRMVTNSLLYGFADQIIASIVPEWTPPEMANKVGKKVGQIASGLDPNTVDGAEPSYNIDNVAVEAVFKDFGIRSGFWRSVGHSYNAFIVETLMDELSVTAKQDPVEFRLAHLTHHPRLTQVLKTAAKVANWNGAELGVHKGVAVHAGFGSFIAHVVILKELNTQVVIDKVVCVIDCGLAISPEVIEQQVRGGIIFGLTAALKTPIQFKDGEIIGDNFDSLPVLRGTEAPHIDVVIIDNQESVGGVGETSVPGIGPALGNALFAYHKIRQREMPFTLDKKISKT